MFKNLKAKWLDDVYMLDIERPNKWVERLGFIKLFFQAKSVRKLFNKAK